jgi:hypothetical protein
MEMLLHSNGHLEISIVAVIDVRNMWKVSMEGSHTPLTLGLEDSSTSVSVCSLERKNLLFI